MEDKGTRDKGRLLSCVSTTQSLLTNQILNVFRGAVLDAS